jgi:VanZ family protein
MGSEVSSRGHGFFVLWAPVVAYMAAIFLVSSLSQPPLPPGVSDKAGHSFGYTGLAIVVVRAIAGGLPRRITWPQAAQALLIAIAFGMSDEFHQSFVPGRSEDIHDLYADATGAAIGTIACWAWGIIVRRKSR